MPDAPCSIGLVSGPRRAGGGRPFVAGRLSLPETTAARKVTVSSTGHRGLLQHLPHKAAGMSRVDPGRLQGPGSTRLRVASSVTKDHVREPKREADRR